MGKGWCACALVLAFSAVPSFAGESDSSGGWEPTPRPSSTQARESFSPQRFSEAYDRAVRKGDQAQHGTSAVVSRSSLELAPLIGKTVLSLLVIVGIICAASYAARRWNGGVFLSSNGPLKVLARQSLSPKSAVYVVAVMERFLIIGESPQGLTCLSQFEDPEENQRIREIWGWEGTAIKDRNRLYTAKTSPFGPSLQSHVEELERELSRLQGAS